MFFFVMKLMKEEKMIVLLTSEAKSRTLGAVSSQADLDDVEGSTSNADIHGSLPFTHGSWRAAH